METNQGDVPCVVRDAKGRKVVSVDPVIREKETRHRVKRAWRSVERQQASFASALVGAVMGDPTNDGIQRTPGADKRARNPADPDRPVSAAYKQAANVAIVATFPAKGRLVLRADKIGKRIGKRRAEEESAAAYAASVAAYFARAANHRANAKALDALGVPAEKVRVAPATLASAAAFEPHGPRAVFAEEAVKAGRVRRRHDPKRIAALLALYK